MIRTLTDATIDPALASPRPVLVEVGAAWCPPCRALAPILDAVAKQREGSLDVVTVDSDESPHAVARFGAMSVPTLLLFKGGELIGRWVGYRSLPKLQTLLDEALVAGHAAAV